MDREENGARMLRDGWGVKKRRDAREALRATPRTVVRSVTMPHRFLVSDETRDAVPADVRERIAAVRKGSGRRHYGYHHADEIRALAGG